MVTILFSVGLIGLSFAGIAIKIIAANDGKFEGTCASQSPFLSDENYCSVCGEVKDCENG